MTLHPVHVSVLRTHSVRSDTCISLVGTNFYAGHFLISGITFQSVGECRHHNYALRIMHYALKKRDAAPAPAVPPNHVPMCFAHSSVRSDTRISLVGTNFYAGHFLISGIIFQSVGECRHHKLRITNYALRIRNADTTITHYELCITH